MGSSSDLIETTQKQVTLISDAKKDETKIVKGGLKTIPFIIANETFEKVASFGLLANMMIYLMSEYNMKVTTGISILFLWNALSNFTPVFGAFLSDSYLGRYRVIALGTIASLLGMILLLLTALIPNARPPHCDHKTQLPCISATLGQRLFLFTSFALMSIGAGGIRPCSIAFGADQMDRPDNPNNNRVLQTFFNWYYASVGVSIMVAVTVIVYIQDRFEWKIGFGVPVGLMLVSTVMFFVGSSYYVKVRGDKNLFRGFACVVSAAWKNRHLPLPINYKSFDDGTWYIQKGSKLVAPTDKLRFLNKAAIMKSPKDDITLEGLAKDPWSLCTVRQVEELKALLKVLPIWSTGIFIAVVMSQHSIWLTQALMMDRSFFTTKFSIPAGSFVVFTILALTIWVAIYDRLVVPLMSKLTQGRYPGFSFHQRIGIGLGISILATAVAAIVERKRRIKFVMHGEIMSAMWLIPQYSLSGLAEAFNAIGQIEFYYSQFPKTMSSVAVALLTLGMAFGNLLGALIVKIVEDWTERGGRVGWLDSNFNKGRVDEYFWVLTLMGFFNLLYFCLCSWAYGNCEERNIWEEGENVVEDVPKYSKDSPAIFIA